MRLSRVVVQVPDLDRAADFYERAFGLRELAVGERGRWRIDLSAQFDVGAGVTLALVGSPGARERYERTPSGPDDLPPFTLTFVVPDVQAAHEQAIAAGAVDETGVVTESDGERTSWLRDPFFNSIQLVSAP